MKRLRCALRESALRFPKAPALVTERYTFSYEMLDRMATHVAVSLRAHGCREKDRIAFYLPNEWSYVVILLGTLRAGRVACPLNVRLPAGQIPSLMRRIACRRLVTYGVTVREEWAGEGIELIWPDQILHHRDRGETATQRMYHHPQQPATIVFTSGSSGRPKAALHTMKNHYLSAAGSNANIQVQPGDRWMLSLPLFHVGGLAILFRCVLGGGAVVTPGENEPLHEALRRYDITHVSLVATQLYRLLQHAPFQNKLSAVLLGGSSIPHSLIEKAHTIGLPLHTSYGLTEMTSQVTTTLPGDGLEQLLTSGKLLPHRELTLAPGGEVLVRGDTLFDGYVEGETIAPPFDSEGWFHTGDLGAWTQSGYLRLCGRKDHLFISGGENIQPEEIEYALCRISGVTEAVVVPVSDREFGQRPVAFVKRALQAPLEDLKGLLRESLPGYKIPKAFYPWPEIPEGDTLKVDRLFFQELAKAKHQ